MSKNQYLIPNISGPYKLNQKSNMHSLSPNIKPLHSQSRKIQNNLFPKNNNNNFNIKVNKIRLKKEKIIEGELNFEDNNKHRFYLLNNQKKSGINNNTNKQQRKRMPNKSPLPIRGTYQPKDIFSFNNLFNSNNKYLNNEQKYNQNLINNYLFINNNNTFQFSKTFNSFYKKGDRSHTPILRTNNNKQIMNLGNKNNSKLRRENKSPILGKSFNFKRNQNFGIAFNNDKKNKYVNNININNINNKAIRGDIHKEPFLNNKNNNFKLKKGVNIVNINLRPISHNNLVNNNKNKINLYDEEVNMAFFKLNSNNNEKNKEIINNINNNIKNESNPRKIARPKSPKNNPNKNNLRLNKNNHIVINDINMEKEENKNKELIKEENNNINNNTLNAKETKQEEQKQKKMIRSHSQTPLDPLNKKSIEDSPIKKTKGEDTIKPPTKKVLKKIRDSYEFTHVGFDGEEPK